MIRIIDTPKWTAGFVFNSVRLVLFWAGIMHAIQSILSWELSRDADLRAAVCLSFVKCGGLTTGPK